MSSMLDAVLLPKTYYKSLSVSKYTFFVCVGIIGVFNIGNLFLFDNFRALFVGQSIQTALFNTALTLLLVLLTGMVDAFVYCRPMVDFFRYVSGKMGGYRDSNLLLKFIKVYTLSAVIVNPLYIFITRVLFSDIEVTHNSAQIQVYLATVCLMQLWSFGIMSRGLNSIMRYRGFQRIFVFLIIATWSFLWATLFRSFLSAFVFPLYLLPK